MKFDIEDNRYRKKKENDRHQKLLIIACLFFATLSIVLIIIYYNTLNPKINKQNTNTEIKKEDIKPKNESEEEEKSNVMPLAIMIDGVLGNSIHAGLQDSYVNYEMLSEDGTTKILSLFRTKEIGIIGPVTSLDHSFLNFAKEHKAVIVSYGMTEYAQKLINADNYNYINGKEDPNAFMQDQELSNHNIYTATSKIEDVITEKNYKTKQLSEVFNYSNNEVNLKDLDGSKKASYINLKYSTNETREYKYDSNNKYYLRSNNGEPDIDRKTNEQLHYKNIIIIYIETDTVARENIIDIDTVGKGEGFFVTNGYEIPIKWEKTSEKSKTVYTYKNGKTLELNDGNTFIQIVPDNE